MEAGIIGGLIAAALIAFFSKKERKGSVYGEIKHGYVPIIVATGALLAILGLVFLGYVTKVWENISDVLILLPIVLVFLVVASYSLLEYFKVKGTFDENSITFSTPWNGKKVLSWNDFEKVEVSDLAGWYVLKFKSDEKIRLSKILNGYGDVLDLLEKKGFDIPKFKVDQ